MTPLFLNSRQINFSSKDLIGEGGEAEIYRLGKRVAMKLFKQANHPNFASLPALQKAAEQKHKERQSKLPSFPSGLPKNVIVPQDLIYNKADYSAEIMAYSMDYLDDCVQLLHFCRRDFQEADGVDRKEILAFFRSIYETLSLIHSAGVVVGDFNGMNVLLKNQTAYFIDADSMQFDKFLCTVFCNRYVDPLLCDLHDGQMTLVRPHNTNSDWYAFNVMLFESLLCVHPYGGVFKPKNPCNRIAANERPLHRISIFHPDVQFPLAAYPLASINPKLLDYFQSVFQIDKREPFPEKLLDAILDNSAPLFSVKAVLAQKPKITASNDVLITKIFNCGGRILQAKVQNEILRLLYWEDGKFMREHGRVVLSGTCDNRMKFELCGDATLIAKDESLISLKPNFSPQKHSVEKYRNEFPVFAANSSAYVWMDAGTIWGQNNERSKALHDALSNQTRIWLGAEWGFGFYQAAEFKRAFLFSCVDSTKLNIPDFMIPGNVLDAEVYFSDDIVWFLAHRKSGAELLNCCFAFDYKGTLLACAEAPLSDDGWLGRISGKCGAGHALLSAVNGGLLQIQIENGQFVEKKKFEIPAMSTNDRLIYSSKGLYVWNAGEVYLVNTQARNEARNDSACANSKQQFLNSNHLK